MCRLSSRWGLQQGDSHSTQHTAHSTQHTAHSTGTLHIHTYTCPHIHARTANTIHTQTNTRTPHFQSAAADWPIAAVCGRRCRSLYLRRLATSKERWFRRSSCASGSNAALRCSLCGHSNGPSLSPFLCQFTQIQLAWLCDKQVGSLVSALGFLGWSQVWRTAGRGVRG